MPWRPDIQSSACAEVAWMMSGGGYQIEKVKRWKLANEE